MNAQGSWHSKIKIRKGEKEASQQGEKRTKRQRGITDRRYSYGRSVLQKIHRQATCPWTSFQPTTKHRKTPKIKNFPINFTHSEHCNANSIKQKTKNKKLTRTRVSKAIPAKFSALRRLPWDGEFERLRLRRWRWSRCFSRARRDPFDCDSAAPFSSFELPCPIASLSTYGDCDSLSKLFCFLIGNVSLQLGTREYILLLYLLL